MARIVFTDAARRDLLRLKQFFDSKNPHAGERIARRIGEAARLLGEFPFIGHGRPDLRPPRRVIAASPYLLVHVSTEDEVVILRVLHERRDLKRVRDR